MHTVLFASFCQEHRAIPGYLWIGWCLGPSECASRRCNRNWTCRLQLTLGTVDLLDPALLKHVAPDLGSLHDGLWSVLLHLVRFELKRPQQFRVWRPPCLGSNDFQTTMTSGINVGTTDINWPHWHQPSCLPSHGAAKPWKKHHSCYPKCWHPKTSKKNPNQQIGSNWD